MKRYDSYDDIIPVERLIMGRLFIKYYKGYNKLAKQYGLEPVTITEDTSKIRKVKKVCFAFLLALLVISWIANNYLDGIYKVVVHTGCFLITLLTLYLLHRHDEKHELEFVVEKTNDIKNIYFQKFRLVCALLDVKNKDELHEIFMSLNDEDGKWWEWRCEINRWILTIATAGIINQIVDIFYKDATLSGILIYICLPIIMLLVIYKEYFYKYVGFEYQDFIEMRDFFRYYKVKCDDKEINKIIAMRKTYLKPSEE